VDRWAKPPTAAPALEPLLVLDDLVDHRGLVEEDGVGRGYLGSAEVIAKAADHKLLSDQFSARINDFRARRARGLLLSVSADGVPGMSPPTRSVRSSPSSYPDNCRAAKAKNKLSE
jgi:hypothetical protein